MAAPFLDRGRCHMYTERRKTDHSYYLTARSTESSGLGNWFTSNIHVLLIYQPLTGEIQDSVTDKYVFSPCDEL